VTVGAQSHEVERVWKASLPIRQSILSLTKALTDEGQVHDGLIEVGEAV